MIRKGDDMHILPRHMSNPPAVGAIGTAVGATTPAGLPTSGAAPTAYILPTSDIGATPPAGPYPGDTPPAGEPIVWDPSIVVDAQPVDEPFAGDLAFSSDGPAPTYAPVPGSPVDYIDLGDAPTFAPVPGSPVDPDGSHGFDLGTPPGFDEGGVLLTVDIDPGASVGVTATAGSGPIPTNDPALALPYGDPAATAVPPIGSGAASPGVTTIAGAAAGPRRGGRGSSRPRFDASALVRALEGMQQLQSYRRAGHSRGR